MLTKSLISVVLKRKIFLYLHNVLDDIQYLWILYDLLTLCRMMFTDFLHKRIMQLSLIVMIHFASETLNFHESFERSHKRKI